MTSLAKVQSVGVCTLPKMALVCVCVCLSACVLRIRRYKYVHMCNSFVAILILPVVVSNKSPENPQKENALRPHHVLPHSNMSSFPWSCLASISSSFPLVILLCPPDPLTRFVCIRRCQRSSVVALDNRAHFPSASYGLISSMAKCRRHRYAR